jgi:hypothetical protein
MLQAGRPVAYEFCHLSLGSEGVRSLTSQDTPCVCHTFLCQPGLCINSQIWTAVGKVHGLPGLVVLYIECKPGRTNPADGLSRMPLPVTPVGDRPDVHTSGACTPGGTTGMLPQEDHRCAGVSSSLASVQRVSAFCLEASAWTSGPALCAPCGVEPACRSSS